MRSKLPKITRNQALLLGGGALVVGAIWYVRSRPRTTSEEIVPVSQIAYIAPTGGGGRRAITTNPEGQIIAPQTPQIIAPQTPTSPTVVPKHSQTTGDVNRYAGLNRNLLPPVLANTNVPGFAPVDPATQPPPPPPQTFNAPPTPTTAPLYIPPGQTSDTSIVWWLT